jgi:hypothetical protein
MAIGIQTVHAQALGIAKTAVLAPASGKQLHLFSARVHNRSGSAMDLGILKKLNPNSWLYYKIVAADTPDATDLTSSIQAGSATQLSTLVNNSGFMVQAKKKFNCLSFVISTGQSGSPTYTYEYWNGAAWATLPTIAVPASYATGEQVVIFLAPADWVAGTDVTTGGSSDMYSVKMKATAAPGTAPLATALVVSQLVEFSEGVADNGELVWKCPAALPLVLDGAEAIIPYCGASNSANAASATYAIQD